MKLKLTWLLWLLLWSTNCEARAALPTGRKEEDFASISPPANLPGTLPQPGLTCKILKTALEFTDKSFI